MKEKELTFEDIIKTETFRSNFKKVIMKIKDDRNKLIYSGRKLKRNPFVGLDEAGRFDDIYQTVKLYDEVIHKISNGLSRNQRDVIENLGNQALLKTVEQITKK